MNDASTFVCERSPRMKGCCHANIRMPKMRVIPDSPFQETWRSRVDTQTFSHRSLAMLVLPIPVFPFPLNFSMTSRAWNTAYS
jgi:hypothetical protein